MPVKEIILPITNSDNFYASFFSDMNLKHKNDDCEIISTKRSDCNFRISWMSFYKKYDGFLLSSSWKSNFFNKEPSSENL